MEFLNLNVKIPIKIRVENLGEIYLDKNSGGKRSKHIEVRYHHIRKKISVGVLRSYLLSLKKIFLMVSRKTTWGTVSETLKVIYELLTLPNTKQGGVLEYRE